MKNLLYITVGSLLLFSSCEKFLSKIPDNRTTLDSPEAVSELLVSAYPEESYVHFTEVMSDNADDKGPGQYIAEYIPNDNAYIWNDNQYDEDSPVAYWNSCYKAIAHSNQALAAIEGAPDKENYRAQKGEALATRAYAHFMLVNIFAKHYNPSTCETELGVPYVTDVETVVIKKYKRETIAEIYQRIEDDLNTAFTLIRDDAYSVPKYHFTQQALHAFASRFYLYKGDWDRVIEHSNKAIGENPLVKIRDWNGKYMNLETKELWAEYTRTGEAANILLNRVYSNWASGTCVFRFSLSSPKIIELFDVGNVIPRFDNVIGSKVLYAAGSEQLGFVPKLPELKEMHGETLYIPYTIVPLFCVEEVLFNRAEANVMKKNYNAALTDMDYYNQKRNTKYDPENKITDEKIQGLYEDKEFKGPVLAPFYGVDGEQQQRYLWYMLDIRRREFIHEGMRWFDIKRFNFEIEHKLFGNGSVKLTKDDLRHAVQIPASAVASGLIPNPR